MADKSKYLHSEQTEVSEYYKNYSPNPFKAWVSDTLTKFIVIFAVIVLYAVAAQIVGSYFFGSDISSAEIQQGFSNME